MRWVPFLAVGILAGWIAGHLTQGKGFGLVGDLVIGIIGAVLGGFLFGLLGMTSYTFVGSLVTATCGAVVLVYVARNIL